jgi:hypothetical protein
MRIDDLDQFIAELQRLRSIHGNVPTFAWDEDRPFEITVEARKVRMVTAVTVEFWEEGS